MINNQANDQRHLAKGELMTTHHDTPYCPIKNPEHYVRGRDYQPIDVIEAFGLCHHLACAVKYIARAGHKDNYLGDLKKAHWYIGRELERHQRGLKPCNEALVSNPPGKMYNIPKDWNLSPGLGKALIAILEFSCEKRFFDWFIGHYTHTDIGAITELQNSILRAHNFLHEEIEAFQCD